MPYTDKPELVTFQTYLKAMEELEVSNLQFTKLCEKVHGKNAATYRYIREHDTSEIRAARDRYNAARRQFCRIGNAYWKSKDYTARKL